MGWKPLTSFQRPLLLGVDPDLTAACWNLRRLLGGRLFGAWPKGDQQQNPHFFCTCDAHSLAFLGRHSARLAVTAGAHVPVWAKLPVAAGPHRQR
jgi:hypothetical protein